MPFLLRQGVLIGLIATISMDILTGIAIRLRAIAPLAPNLVGRWFASVLRGRPIHANIAQAAAVPHEMALAIPGHYAIGITLACIYVWSTTQLAWPARRADVALGFALSTNSLPWLLMFPAMGYGLFGLHGPAGTRLFTSSLVSHAFYGVGLWVAARVVQPH